MNNIKSSPMFLFSFYQYSYAYELKQSPYVMNLVCRTSCLIIHTMYMERTRAKLRWRFVVPSALPRSYACRFVGSESWEDLGSFPMHERSAQVYENLRI
jgi:hypothetical protein